MVDWGYLKMLFQVQWLYNVKWDGNMIILVKWKEIRRWWSWSALQYPNSHLRRLRKTLKNIRIAHHLDETENEYSLNISLEFHYNITCSVRVVKILTAMPSMISNVQNLLLALTHRKYVSKTKRYNYKYWGSIHISDHTVKKYGSNKHALTMLESFANSVWRYNVHQEW
jgi:hypothetical protein